MIFVTREDLPFLGSILAQTVHAAIEFCLTHTELAHDWHNISNYVACLAIKNEEELLKLADKLKSKNVTFSLFREPDFNNEATSICIEACDESRRYTSNLKLALKSPIGVNGQHSWLPNPGDTGSIPVWGTNNKPINQST